MYIKNYVIFIDNVLKKLIDKILSFSRRNDTYSIILFEKDDITD